MKQEMEIQKYIQENGWNINYDGNTATNIFGTEYNVTIQDTKDYFDFSNVQLKTKEITIKDICEFHQDVFNAEGGTEHMAYALAHEVAHTETYAIHSALALGLLGLGLVRTIQSKDPKTFLKWSFSALLGTYFLSEATAEAGAYFIHGARIEGNLGLYKTLLDLL
ncbi:MAG: hypothetical protein Q8R18_06475 [bacterium]|nr:hypothetical protein [bacterium]